MGKRNLSNGFKRKSASKGPPALEAKKRKVIDSKPQKLSQDTGKQSSGDKPETWSKSKKKRMRMLRAKMKSKDKETVLAEKTGTKKADSTNLASTTVEDIQLRKSTLQDAFKARLTGSRFRILNEELYTTTSKESFDRFTKNPELFEQYHEGFRHQVESWPTNPVDVIVKWLSSKYQESTSCVVADFGCGDAQLAKDLLKVKKKGKPLFNVHSFDLVSPNELVTACDMADVPLKNKSVDVCVFCLSLMGTNLADFVREAHRVLKDDGKVKIAEVRSRIEYSHSNSSTASKSKTKDQTNRNAGTLSEFVDVLKELGFKCTKTDRSNKMFLLLELEKTGKSPNKKLAFSAKPCIYKRR